MKVINPTSIQVIQAAQVDQQQQDGKGHVHRPSIHQAQDQRETPGALRKMHVALLQKPQKKRPKQEFR